MKKLLNRIFKGRKVRDDYEFAREIPDFENKGISIETWLEKSGFKAEKTIFYQIGVYIHPEFRCVLVSEYSDNTGLKYWRYFSDVQEYNSAMRVSLGKYHKEFPQGE